MGNSKGNHKASLANRCKKCKTTSMVNSHHKVCSMGTMFGNSNVNRQSNSNRKVSLGRTWGSNQIGTHYKAWLLGNSQGNSHSKVGLGRAWVTKAWVS